MPVGRDLSVTLGSPQRRVVAAFFLLFGLGGISVFLVTAAFGFAFTASHFGKAPSNQGLLPLSFGASPRLGMPSLRSCSVGPPPSAIHGRGRLTRHPCRVAHCAEPPLGLSRGRCIEDQKLQASLTARPLSGEQVNAFPCRSCRAKASAAMLLILPLPLPLLLLLLWLLDLLPLSQRPNAGVAQGAPRQGCRGSRPRPWMADGGGPPEQCRSEGMPSLGEAPNGGAKPFAYFWRFSKVTRCKSETVSSHHRRNGYTHNLAQIKMPGRSRAFQTQTQVGR